MQTTLRQFCFMLAAVVAMVAVRGGGRKVFERGRCVCSNGRGGDVIYGKFRETYPEECQAESVYVEYELFEGSIARSQALDKLTSAVDRSEFPHPAFPNGFHAAIELGADIIVGGRRAKISDGGGDGKTDDAGL
jgi:hypothetical protein